MAPLFQAGSFIDAFRWVAGMHWCECLLHDVGDISKCRKSEDCSIQMEAYSRELVPRLTSYLLTEHLTWMLCSSIREFIAPNEHRLDGIRLKQAYEVNYSTSTLRRALVHLPGDRECQWCRVCQIY